MALFYYLLRFLKSEIIWTDDTCGYVTYDVCCFQLDMKYGYIGIWRLYGFNLYIYIQGEQQSRTHTSSMTSRCESYYLQLTVAAVSTDDKVMLWLLSVH